MEQGPPVGQSRAHRATVLLTATLEVEGGLVLVKLRNLSQHGALIESDHCPPEGTICWFQRNDMRLGARIVWVQGRCAGLKFDRELKTAEILRSISKPQPKVEQDYRRPRLT
jgi:hypothetical protein